MVDREKQVQGVMWPDVVAISHIPGAVARYSLAMVLLALRDVAVKVAFFSATGTAPSVQERYPYG